MSFKIKKWAQLRTVRLADYIPGLKSYQNPGGAGINTSSYVYPWQKYILCLCYEDDDTPVWVKYDPIADTCEGPFTGPGKAWSIYSYFYGESCYYGYWGNQYFLGRPGGAMGYGNPSFWGWDAGCNFWTCDFDLPFGGEGSPITYPSSTIGTPDGSTLTVMACSWQQSGDVRYQEWGAFALGGGYTVLHRHLRGSTPGFYIPFSDGSKYNLRQLGSYYGGSIIWIDGGQTYSKGVLWPAIPHTDNVSDYLVEGSFGGGLLTSDPMGMTFGPTLGTGAAILKATIGGVESWPLATSPLGGGTRPYQSRWDYYHQLEGFEIDQLDLDGIDHSPAYVQPVGRKPISMAANGWYFASSTNTGTQFSVYVMDPWQHAGVSMSGAKADGIAGWVGDYAIDSDLNLKHVLPFPDQRGPQGGLAQPPLERTDGTILGRKEVFRHRGTSVEYARDIVMDLSGYSHGGDWWFPGEDEAHHYPGFWNMFAGAGPTVIAYMLDPSYGMINPGGQNCMRLMGVPTENLESDVTHVVKNSQAVTDAAFATPASILTGGRRQLISSHDGSIFVYTESGLRLGSPPLWKAVVGTIKGTKWTTLLDFAEVESPGLWETGWTVWSVTPLQASREIPRGGYLVGATLYFDPWKENDWEWTPGDRETVCSLWDKAWVPARPGWDGPVQTQDVNAPKLLTAYDEWTVGRSLYGPDALLLYDHEGRFVRCLNSLDVYPPNGKEVMVTDERLPKLIFRIYRWGVYSDFGEYETQFVRIGEDADVQCPIYAVYDLYGKGGTMPGAFRGFVNMYDVSKYSTNPNTWRWGVADTLYAWDAPNILWAPPGQSYVRSGRGGRGITILRPGPGQGRSGVTGVGRRA